jgi:hypothetical protein
MPQNPVLVYEKEGGLPTYMHTVDAAEAVRLGDYTPAPPGGKEPEPEARASAMSRFRTGQGMTHPEMQTEEERDAARQKANEEAELMAGVPAGASVVVMAPGKSGESPAAPRGASAAARGGAPSSSPSSSTSSSATSGTPTPRKD